MSVNEATTSQCFRLYGRLMSKKRKLLLDIQFLTKCKRRGLIPKFICVRMSTHTRASSVAKKSAQKIWLAEEIKAKHQALSTIDEDLYSLHLELLTRVNYHTTAECVVLECVQKKKVCWQTVLATVHRNLDKRVCSTKQRHRRKLASLAHEQKVKRSIRTPQTIDNFVVNLSSVELTPEENGLLNKGLNFAVPGKYAPVAEIVNNIESAIQFNNYPSKAALRHDVGEFIGNVLEAKSCAKPRASNLDFVIDQMKKHEVVYTRADKGNAVVVMNKPDYDERVLDMIASGPYTECKHKNGKPKDPLNQMIEESNCARQKVADLMGEAKLERKFLVPNPKVSSLYCLPKIHKNPVAMRPISSNICTPTVKMAAWLIDEMKKYPISYGKSVKNSVDFVEKVKGLEVRRGEILVSFDVSALFPSVPVPEALHSLRKHLERRRAPPNCIEAYLTVAEVCMKQNYFLFRGKFYKQTFGLSMGSKLSPILAELFMSDFETELENNKLFPRVWWRYVDDVFATVKERYLPQILELLNSRHSSIKFTVEKEEGGKLPFLDLIISRKEDNTVKFGIYRKPTSTDRYITVDSNHHGAQKQAAFHSMAHRLFNIPMEKDEFEAEKLKIRQAAILNGFEEDFADKIIRKHQRKKRRSEVTTFKPEKEEVKRISLPFYPKVTNPIQKILSEHGYKTAYKSGNTLKERLCSLKDKIPQEEKSGVYEIPCKSCPAVYIGQTRRKLKVRLKEHRKAVQNLKTNNSSVATHVMENDHEIDWENAKLRKWVQKSSHLNAWESMYINTTEAPLMNEDDPPIISPLFQLTTRKIQ